MRVAVVGASGLIGRRLARALLERGDEVVALSRSGRRVEGTRVVRWVPEQEPFPEEARRGTDAIVNLAGSPMGPRPWTARRRREMRRSRVVPADGVAAALGDGGPGVLVNSGGTGFYGVGEREVDERASAGDDFLARTCVLWDRAAAAGAERGARVVRLRIGIMLAAEAGALPTLALPVRLFVGGPLGGGRQWMPWVHVEDAIGMILFALDRSDVSGPVNVTAPDPVRQRDFVRALGRVLRRPSILHAPAWPLRLALGEAATLALDGQRAVPAVALAAGYRFRFTDLEAALRDLLGPERR